MFDLTAKHFQDEDSAREHIESNRWANGKFCPHCGGLERIYEIKARAERKIRKGLHKCGDCKKQFTVTVGTVFEGSRVPLNKWLLAIHLMCASKKGISAHQIHRMIGVTYKTAWFMCHRIREAMSDGNTPLGGEGETLEADETFWGKDPAHKDAKTKRSTHKLKIFSLVERGGKVRSFHVSSVQAKTLRPILRDQVAEGTIVYTDGAGQYRKLKEDFPTHDTVAHHRGEYVRGNVHTNTIEGFFSLLKRGLNGTFHHVSPEHLKRYVGEFDFRYNHRHITDKQRAAACLFGISGKRLMYKAVV